ncbi:MAG: transporter substrate-binding domain-containing protein [Bermanella sp.]
MIRVLPQLLLCLACLTIARQAIATVETLDVAVPPFAPFAFFKENTKCEGASISILNRLAKDVGIEFQHVRYPYARILSSLKTGQLDMALIFKNDSIKESVNYIGPISKSKVVVLTKIDKPVSHYEELASLNFIAVIRKAHFEPRFDNDTNIKKVAVESYLQALNMFSFDRVDAVVGSLSGLEYAMQELNLNVNLLENAYYLSDKEWWLHISKKTSHPRLIARITKAVENIYHPNLIYQAYKQQVNRCLIAN